MNLADFIKNNDITNHELAKSARCGQPMISMISRGQRRPSSRLALRIEQATGGQVTRDELLFPELYLGDQAAEHQDQDAA